MAGIYIHIPFCKKACHYCDFHFSTSLKHKGEMLQAIQKELKLRAEELKGQKIETVYFGGGTPSLLTVYELESLWKVIEACFYLSTTPEVTLEANPDDLSEEKIKAISRTAVNRLSIGVQSFFDEDLMKMNRAHTGEESVRCLELATQYFDNITIDLMYGVPGMSNERWQANLNQAFALKIPHISSYALTVEEKTALASFIKNKTYPPLDDNLALMHFNTLIAETEKQGFVQYEISNFGKENYFSKHNTSYWKGKPYIGIGPSAHSFSGTHRAWNIANNAKYIKSIKSSNLPLEIEELSVADQYNEYIMTGLRTIYGVSIEKIETNFGEKYKNHIKAEMDCFLKDKTLHYSEGIIKTTRKGKFLADGIASELFYVV